MHHQRKHGGRRFETDEQHARRSVSGTRLRAIPRVEPEPVDSSPVMGIVASGSILLGIAALTMAGAKLVGWHVSWWVVSAPVLAPSVALCAWLFVSNVAHWLAATFARLVSGR
jgi:hypothetical protein